MTKIAAFLLSFFLGFSAAANCQLETKDRIILVSKDQSLSIGDIGEVSQCQQSQIQDFMQFIQGSQGVLKQSTVRQEVESLSDVKVTPSVIRISHLSDIIKSRLSLDKNIYVTEIKPLKRQALYGLSSSQSISFSCQDCDKLGSNNVKMTFSDSLTGEEKSHWLRIKIKKEVAALVPAQSLSVTHKSLRKSHFHESKILTSKPHELFTDVEHIIFYKLNRNINEGQPLKKNMLSPQSLVKPGKPAQIILVNQYIKLSGKANPIRPATLGEIVKLRRVQNNKIVIGKVIDYNKVKIEL